MTTKRKLLIAILILNVLIIIPLLSFTIIHSNRNKIGKNVRLTNYEVELEDVKFGYTLCNLCWDDDYLLPTETNHYDIEASYINSNSTGSALISSGSDRVFCVITYKVKNISKEMIDISSDLRVGKFKVVYNDEYYLTDLSQSGVTPSALRYPAIKNEKDNDKITIHPGSEQVIEKQRKWLQKNGTVPNMVYTSYEPLKGDEYFLYPLETKEVREYIEIPKDMFEKYKGNLKIEQAFIKNLSYLGGDMDQGAYEKVLWDLN
jgi:hypothetical protein